MLPNEFEIIWTTFSICIPMFDVVVWCVFSIIFCIKMVELRTFALTDIVWGAGILRIAECGKLSRGNLRKIKCGTFRKLPLSLFRNPQPKNSAFPRMAKLPFARIAQQMCNRCIPSRGPLKNEKNERWFIGYSSSMLDCTSNKTIKQEHTIQNYNTPVTHNVQ